MLRKETVEEGTLDLVKSLMADNKLGDFNLVGGTALSLMIGHRKSVDIDLFTAKDFNSSEIANHLTSTYNAISVQAINNGVFCFINDIKIDVLAHKYSLVGNLEVVEGIRMVSLLDIGAMKLNAIYNNGTRLKDFVDMYALLQYFPLEQLLKGFEQKYPDIDILVVKNALLYHHDIQSEEPIDYIGPEIKWPIIADRLKKACDNPRLTFGETTELTRKLMEKIQQQKPIQHRRRRL
jgi:hypothetical protein